TPIEGQLRLRRMLGSGRASSRACASESMSTLDLDREVRRAPRLAIDLTRVREEDLEAARTNWSNRMVSEHASARVFASLVAQMMRAGLPEAETYRVAEMARQELDHARLCARVLASLGVA